MNETRVPASVAPRRVRRGPLVALVGVALATAGVELWRRDLGGGAPPTDLPPNGWWVLAGGSDGARATGAGSEAEARASLLSLPYAAGVRPPETGPTGVVALDPTRAQPGVALVVSAHAPEIELLAVDGTALFAWRLPFERAFPGRRETRDTQSFRRAALAANGDLIALYQGGGLVRLRPNGEILWASATAAYNDLWLSADGARLLTIGKRARDGRPWGRSELLDDAIVELDPESGRERSRSSLLDAFARSAFAATLLPLGGDVDAIHANTISVFDGSDVAASPLAAAGNLVVSLREVDVVAVLDPTAKTVLWARRGPYRAQHDPQPIPGGRLLLFDNRGAGRGSRLLVLRLGDASVAGVAPFLDLDPIALASAQAGAVARLDNGNFVVVASERGRAFELAADGTIVWEYRSPHRAGPRDRYVAVLYDVVRLAPGTPGLAALPVRSGPVPVTAR